MHCYRQRTNKAGGSRGADGAPSHSRGTHAKASSSSGRAYTSSDGLPPQLRPGGAHEQCTTCGSETAGTDLHKYGARQCLECHRRCQAFDQAQVQPLQNASASAGQASNAKLVGTRRTPRKRTLSLADEDMVDPPLEGRGRMRGSRETSRDDSSNAKELETAHFLNGEAGCCLCTCRT